LIEETGPLPGASRLSLSPEGRGLGSARPNPLPSGERDSLRSKQGEGVKGRGKTSDHMLERARTLRQGQTEAEDKLWSRVRAKWLQGFKFKRQEPFSERYIADFVCPSRKLIVELDGSQHADDLAYDTLRSRFFESQGYRVVRFWNNDVFLNLDGVLDAIYAALTGPLPGPAGLSLSPRGRGLGSANQNPLPLGERDSLRSKQGEGL
jgi:very-short-patch-repair endonuclease